LTDAVNAYFQGLNITSPDVSPNFIYIPHIIDSYVAKSISANGLKGQDLYNAVYEAFCKKPQQTKEQIKKAHKTIKPSSN